MPPLNVVVGPLSGALVHVPQGQAVVHCQPGDFEIPAKVVEMGLGEMALNQNYTK